MADPETLAARKAAAEARARMFAGKMRKAVDTDSEVENARARKAAAMARARMFAGKMREAVDTDSDIEDSDDSDESDEEDDTAAEGILGNSQVPKKTKICVFSFNAFFWFIALGMNVASLWAWSQTEFIDNVNSISSTPFDPIAVMFVIGQVMFWVSMLGGIGALRENIFLLKTFNISMSMLLVVEVFIILFMIACESWFISRFGDFFTSTIVNYRDSLDLQNIMDFTQKFLECCGATDGPNDWNNNIYFNCNGTVKVNGIDYVLIESCGVPSSCCKEKEGEVFNAQCGYDVRNIQVVSASERIETINERPCLESFEEWLGENFIIVAICCAVLGLLQAIPIYFAQSIINEVEAIRERAEKFAKWLQQPKAYKPTDSSVPISEARKRWQRAIAKVMERNRERKEKERASRRAKVRRKLRRQKRAEKAERKKAREEKGEEQKEEKPNATFFDTLTKKSKKKKRKKKKEKRREEREKEKKEKKEKKEMEEEIELTTQNVEERSQSVVEEMQVEEKPAQEITPGAVLFSLISSVLGTTTEPEKLQAKPPTLPEDTEDVSKPDDEDAEQLHASDQLVNELVKSDLTDEDGSKTVMHKSADDGNEASTSKKFNREDFERKGEKEKKAKEKKKKEPEEEEGSWFL